MTSNSTPCNMSKKLFHGKDIIFCYLQSILGHTATLRLSAAIVFVLSIVIECSVWKTKSELRLYGESEALQVPIDAHDATLKKALVTLNSLFSKMIKRVIAIAKIVVVQCLVGMRLLIIKVKVEVDHKTIKTQSKTGKMICGSPPVERRKTNKGS